jgi:acylphosphatase
MTTNETPDSPTSGAARLHLTISGRVQGVGFRYFVVETAENLGLKGWVRNTWDGKVELVAEGSRVDLELLRDRAAQGPPSSFVTDIQESWEAATGQFTRFFVASSS